LATFSFEVILSTKTTSEFKKLKIWILKTTSNEKTTNREILGLDKLWIFVVDNVLVWNHLVMENYFWILKFDFFLNKIGWKNHQNKSCRSSNVMKLCNWNFFIWNHLIIEKFTWSFQIWNLNFVNGLVCRNYQNRTCRSWKVMQLYSWSHFQMNSFSASNNQITLGLL
jgi:hypothetical protein